MVVLDIICKKEDCIFNKEGYCDCLFIEIDENGRCTSMETEDEWVEEEGIGWER